MQGNVAETASDSGNNEHAYSNTSKQRQHRGARHIVYLYRQCYNDGAA